MFSGLQDANSDFFKPILKFFFSNLNLFILIRG